ncbi:MAG: serine hydrolase, partial [Planctomycetota bacterium]
MHSGGGGEAITASSNNGNSIPFTANTEMTVASVAKTITATALLHLLDAQNISIDSPISPYLPPTWQQGPNIGAAPGYSGVTFRDLLTHRSGIRRIDFDNSGSASLAEQTRESGLRQLIAIGIGEYDLNGNGMDDEGEERDSLRSRFSYENANFALMRVMIPYIWNAIPDSVLNGDSPLSDLPSSVQTYVEGDWNGDITGERLRASIYKYYVISNVFQPMGINGAATEGFGPNQTRTYPFPAGDAPGYTMNDRTLQSGGEGWFLDARELGTFLHHITHENTVLSNATRQTMQSDSLGFKDPSITGYASGLFGDYHVHGGDLNNLNTGIAVFPNDVEAALLINSDMASGLRYQVSELKAAYENAWTTITINGTSEADAFLLESGDGPASLRVRLNGDTIGEFQSGKLETLIIRGLQGDDSFVVDAVPSNIEVVLRGGQGDDEMEIGGGDLDSNILGSVRPFGGSGDDYLLIDDGDDLVGADSYDIVGNSITKTNLMSSITYDSFDWMRVYANPQDNAITVLQPSAGTGISIFGQRGDDTILVSGVTLETSIIADGRGGNDTLEVRDLHFAETGYLSFSGLDGNDTLRARNLTGDLGARLRLNGGSDDDLLVVDQMSGDIEVSLRGDSGDDSLKVLEAASSERMLVDGGNGKDAIRLGG